MVFAFKMIGKIMNLGMTVMAGSNTIICACSHYLVKFYLSILVTCFNETGLEISAASSATIVV